MISLRILIVTEMIWSKFCQRDVVQVVYRQIEKVQGKNSFNLVDQTANATRQTGIYKNWLNSLKPALSQDGTLLSPLVEKLKDVLGTK